MEKMGSKEEVKQKKKFFGPIQKPPKLERLRFRKVTKQKQKRSQRAAGRGALKTKKKKTELG